MAEEAITVLQLNRRMSDAIAVAPGLRNIWVIGETSDLRESGGHCYMDLIEKDTQGSTVAKVRAAIWRSQWGGIARTFTAATGARLASGMKIMARLSVSYNAQYGMTATISEIDATYTIGDAVRRRNEIIARLKTEGLLELNRQVPWHLPPLRVAVISGRTAAGYGDFVTHLFRNPERFNFSVRLFPALMQGDRAGQSVMSALAEIALNASEYDAVVIIRGGGATTDLAAFDNYELAAAVARFPIPVVVGIGHERDVTVLDYVANYRVKTPTAAAELLIAGARKVMTTLEEHTRAIAELVTARMEGLARQLEVYSATLPGYATSALSIQRQRLSVAALDLARIPATVIAPRLAQLQVIAGQVTTAASGTIEKQYVRLENIERMLAVLSPDAVLRRGFSLTTDAQGRAITSVQDLSDGMQVRTRLKDGTFESLVIKK